VTAAICNKGCKGLSMGRVAEIHMEIHKGHDVTPDLVVEEALRAVKEAAYDEGVWATQDPYYHDAALAENPYRRAGE